MAICYDVSLARRGDWYFHHGCEIADPHTTHDLVLKLATCNEYASSSPFRSASVEDVTAVLTHGNDIQRAQPGIEVLKELVRRQEVILTFNH